MQKLLVKLNGTPTEVYRAKDVDDMVLEFEDLKMQLDAARDAHDVQVAQIACLVEREKDLTDKLGKALAVVQKVQAAVNAEYTLYYLGGWDPAAPGGDFSVHPGQVGEALCYDDAVQGCNP